MKKTLTVMIMILLSAMLIVSCNNSSKKVYTVTFDSNGGSEVDPVNVKYGETVSKPTDPTRENYDFIKWISDESGETEYSFDTTVTKDITVYAQWRACYKEGNPGPAGGIIFYAKDSYSDGWKYLEDAPNDANSSSFGGANILVGTGIGSGKSNTEKLVAKSSDFGAAKVCDDYSVTADGKTYDDWFLPSKDELNEMYKNKDKITNLGDYTYLSSSEDGATNAWRQLFSNGEQASYHRGTVYYIRPVRAF